MLATLLFLRCFLCAVGDAVGSDGGEGGRSVVSDADGGVVGSGVVCDNVGSEVVGDTGGDMVESM